MSSNKPNFLPFFASASVAGVAGVYSTAALALDEEEANGRTDQILLVASDVVTSAFIDGCSTPGVFLHGFPEEDQCPRKYTCWDRKRVLYQQRLPWAGPFIWSRRIQKNLLHIPLKLCSTM